MNFRNSVIICGGCADSCTIVRRFFHTLEPFCLSMIPHRVSEGSCPRRKLINFSLPLFNPQLWQQLLRILWFCPTLLGPNVLSNLILWIQIRISSMLFVFHSADSSYGIRYEPRLIGAFSFFSAKNFTMAGQL